MEIHLTDKFKVKTWIFERLKAFRQIKWNPVIISLLIVYVMELFLTAWISDDAFIGAAIAENFLNGFGLRYNIIERTQVFTNPFFMSFVIFARSITGEPYFSLLAVNMTTSFVAVCILASYAHKTACNIAEEDWMGGGNIIPLIILIFSNSFIDYSTSGLENSLMFLLIAIFSVLFFNDSEFDGKKLFHVALVACLLVFTRMDTALLVFPSLVYAFFISRKVELKKAILIGFAAFSPFIIWELFSLVYYGFLFPNTMYAKLNGGIPSHEYLQHGLEYFFGTLSWDLIGVAAMLFSILAALMLFIKHNDVKALCFCSGMLLYLIYIFSVGGDFMLGRFYSILIFCSAIIISKLELKKAHIIFISALIAIVGLSRVNNILTLTKNYHASAAENNYNTSAVDERFVYYPATGLLRYYRGETYQRNNSYQDVLQYQDEKVIVLMVGGMVRLALPPETQLVDSLSDPLLARLPAPYFPDWRTGHLYRLIRSDYIETLKTGKNVIEDGGVREYYNILRDIVSGDIFTVRRFKHIIQMNLGKFDNLIDFDKYRYPTVTKNAVIADSAMVNSLTEIKKLNTPWNAPGNIILDNNGIKVNLAAVRASRKLTITVDNNDYYDAAFLLAGKVVAIRQKKPTVGKGLSAFNIELTEKEVEAGYDSIVVVPSSNYFRGSNGDGLYSVGHIKFE
jgi:arabinofuranosyltransferase